MAKWEIAVWGKDEEDLPSGHKRIKEGDIVAFKPYPATWGPEASKKCLITVVDGLTEEEVSSLKAPHYEDDSLGDDIENPKVIIAKRRFHIPLDTIKESMTDLDLTKVRDNEVVYQPFKTKEQVEAGFDNQAVADCKDTEEYSIDNSKVPIITDKHEK